MVQELQTATIALLIIFPAIGTFFCGLRLWSRTMLAKGSWTGLMLWSDILLAIAWVLSISETYTTCFFVKKAGLGYHVDNLPIPTLDDLEEVGKYTLATQLLYNPILGFVKASVILLMLRLAGSRKDIRIASYVLLVFNFAHMIMVLLVIIFQCKPVSYVYAGARMDLEAQLAAGADSKGMLNGKLVTGGQCINTLQFFLTAASFTIFTDFVVLCIPTWFVWNLQMKVAKKIIVVIILGMGIGVTIAGIIRLPLLMAIYDPTITDPTYSVGISISNIETGLAITTACIPDLAPVLRRIAPGILGTSAAATSGYSGQRYSSRPTRMGYVVNKSSNGTGTDEVDSDGYPLKSWRNDNTTQGTVTVKGGAASKSSRNGSQDGIIPKNNQITKTTYFSVSESK